MVVVVPEELKPELFVESSLLLQEIMVRLKRNIKIMCKIFFIFSSIPKVKYYCLCIRRTQCIPLIGLFYKNRGRLWRVSECEELVGVSHRRLLGQSSVTATSAYLGITDESALDIARIYIF